MEIDVSVSPRSDRSGADGIDEWRARLNLRVKAPPVGGKADREVEEFFAKASGHPSEVVRGMTSRQKTVMIHGDPTEIIRAMEARI